MEGMQVRPESQRLRNLGLAFVAGFALLRASDARAWPHYFEFGGGLAKWSDAAPTFQSVGAGTATKSSDGFTIPFTLGLQLQERTKGVLFSIAAQSRYYSGTTEGGQAFSLVTTGPAFRIEYWRIVLGATYGVWGFKDITFKKASAIQSSLTLEAQFLFPITPEIDFGLMAAQSTVKTDNDLAPAVFPAKTMEYGAFFRLNFGYTAAQASERRKYKGWRYPLGNPLR
jgi:hypothetical protein